VSPKSQINCNPLIILKKKLELNW